MKEQTFVVKLGVPPHFKNCFPKVESQYMASLIRDAVRANSRSRIGLVQFNVIVERGRDVASADGEIGWHAPEQFNDIPDELAVEPSF